ncbi:MAG: phosphatase PAP2 family protein [Chloroflexi bacterium]|nr:phosphatase PAP2 family protein [Chloroflexota bacterium]
MTPILEWGNNLIVSIQSIGSSWVLPMTLLSFLGTEQFFILIAPLVYWCIDVNLGLRMSVYLMICAGLDEALKVLWHAPRPYWIDSRVKAYSVETTFGIPSGHSMKSTVIWGSLAVTLRKGIGWFISLLLIFLIGFSRLYLGMHFPSDVLAGWFLGALLLILLFWLEKPIVMWVKRKTTTNKIILAFILSVALIFINWLSHLSLGNWQVPVIWIQNAATATEIFEPINPLDPSNAISASGALFGLALGYFLLETKGGFQTKGSMWDKITRFFIGLVGIILLWKGLGMLLPDASDLASLTLRYMRYTLVGAWITGGAPWIFLRCKLAEKTSLPH